ncbi:MAG TPA: 3-dehydroquinate synthase [Clostridiales bacterium]|nr:3-dehydroquinate synthase [Clostridiales bacterium]
METLIVKAEKKYDIYIDSNWLEDVQKEILSKYPEEKILVVIDENVDKIYAEKLVTLFSKKRVKKYILPSGENSKNINEYASILAELARSNFTRNDLIIALGGGVVGDLGGFVASTYLRGIRFIQIPTTLLSMIDSSIGGKTAIDFDNKKNIIGAFYSPTNVYIDTKLLETLPEEELLSGYGELVKYAILDKKIYKLINKDIEIKDLIKACLSYKKSIVQKDFKEKNLRMLLNLGHTIGHAIEAKSKFRIKHGAAVALGIIYATKISNKLNLLKESEQIKIFNLLKKFNLYSEKEFDVKDYVYSDKKISSNGKINFVAMQKIGKCKIIAITLEEFIKLL